MQEFRKTARRARAAALLLVSSGILTLLVSVSLGAMDISVIRVAKIILGKITGAEALLQGIPLKQQAVVWDIRLPRVLCGFFVGAGLATAGVIFQSLLSNPLADPYTLGVSTGAAFGASLVIYSNVMYETAYPVVPAAFLFAALALMMVIVIAGRGGGLKSSNLIIAGMIISAILSSAISMLKMLSGEKVSAIIYWMMGSVSGKSWPELFFLAPLVTLGVLIAVWDARALNVMTLGERSAEALGVNVRRTRLVHLLAGAMITAACVSTGGIIGFIGLIVPHMLRMSVTGDNRRLLPLSFLAGGLLLMAADDCARLIGRGEIPVGVLTTLLGGPFFIHLFLKRRSA